MVSGSFKPEHSNLNGTKCLPLARWPISDRDYAQNSCLRSVAVFHAVVRWCVCHSFHKTVAVAPQINLPNHFRKGFWEKWLWHIFVKVAECMYTLVFLFKILVFSGILAGCDLATSRSAWVCVQVLLCGNNVFVSFLIDCRPFGGHLKIFIRNFS